MNLFDDELPYPLNLNMPDAEVFFYPNFFSLQESDNYFSQLQSEVEWSQETISFYGETHNLPRLTAWYGDADKRYTYSGISVNSMKWISTLLSIKKKIETIEDKNFNSVLLNFYRDNKDSVSWHSDDEKELGINPIIASVSFGEERKFQFKHKNDSSLKNEIILTNGSLLLMKGTTQHFWMHQIPKSSKQMKGRINLTFRRIV